MPSHTLKVIAPLLVVDSQTILRNSAVIVNDGIVTKIIPAEASSKIKTDSTVQLEKSILHPGFINAHCHLDLSCMEGRLTPKKSFTHWIRELVDEKRIIENSEIDTGIQKGIERLLETGTTCVGDVTSKSDMANLLRKSGIRAVIFYETLGFDGKAADERFRELVIKIKHSKESPLISNGVSPHAVYSTSKKLFAKSVKYANKKGFPLATHLAETEEEILFSKKGTGIFAELLKEMNLFDEGLVPRKSPVKFVKETGALKEGLLIHLNHLGIGETADIKKEGAKVVVCPNSNKWFARKMTAPVYDFIDKNIPLGLGTDSLASNTDLDMRSEARSLLKTYHNLDIKTVFHIATEGGAKCLGLPKGYGTLREGSPFDACAVKTSFNENDDPLTAIMSGCNKIEKVWVNGVLRHGN